VRDDFKSWISSTQSHELEGTIFKGPKVVRGTSPLHEGNYMGRKITEACSVRKGEEADL